MSDVEPEADEDAAAEETTESGEEDPAPPGYGASYGETLEYDRAMQAKAEAEAAAGAEAPADAETVAADAGDGETQS